MNGGRIAEQGLEQDRLKAPAEARKPARAELARWLRDHASAAGEAEWALRAARVVMEADPSLMDYRALQTLAGEQWPALREEVLAGLRRRASYYPKREIEIFLSEGRIDDAIAVLGNTEHHELVEPVADAAIESRPDWAIQACRRQAERIILPAKAQYYYYAARWLEKARAAYRAAGREEEWKQYLEQLLVDHGRKYKLVPMLQALR